MVIMMLSVGGVLGVDDDGGDYGAAEKSEEYVLARAVRDCVQLGLKSREARS